MKAIQTRYSGPTNTRGARIIARAEGSKARSFPYSHGASDPHRAAASEYAASLGWYGTYASATLPDSSQAHVPVFNGAGGSTWDIKRSE